MERESSTMMSFHCGRGRRRGRGRSSSRSRSRSRRRLNQWLLEAECELEVALLLLMDLLVLHLLQHHCGKRHGGNGGLGGNVPSSPRHCFERKERLKRDREKES